MKQELLLESYLKDLRLSRFVQSYQSLAQEAARTNLSYERYLLALVQEEVAHREAQRIERAIGEAHSTGFEPLTLGSEPRRSFKRASPRPA